ncbi:MAG: chromosome segregation protein Spc25-domain-containing protein [Benniella sp.]|nr:MAG: chromosome segregation protein Spc25-domain-containing protein [Benniella sp.]
MASASSTLVASNSGSFRNSTGGRLSFMEGSSHRLSIGSNRLSLLPAKNNIVLPTLPTPQFDSDELSARITTFTNDVNIGVQKIKAKITENTEQWVQETSELRGRNLELSEELKIATENEVKLAEALLKWKTEISLLSKAAQELTAQHDDMKQKHEAVIDQVATLRREVKAKREAKIAFKKALEQQALKNKPELASFESVLSLRIVGVQEDQIGFVFTRINELDWEQECSITVDVSQHEYAVAECSPILPGLSSLVRYLNDTRDFYGFIKRVRKAFKDMTKK